MGAVALFADRHETAYVPTRQNTSAMVRSPPWRMGSNPLRYQKQVDSLLLHAPRHLLCLPDLTNGPHVERGHGNSRISNGPPRMMRPAVSMCCLQECNGTLRVPSFQMRRTRLASIDSAALICVRV